MSETITTKGRGSILPPPVPGFGRMLAALIAIVFVLWAHDTLLLFFAGVLGAIAPRLGCR